MKTLSIFVLAASGVLLTVVDTEARRPTPAAVQAEKQVAVALGAIRLGTDLGVASDQEVLGALEDGLAMLAARSKRTPEVQTPAFRAQLEQAGLDALNSPVNVAPELSPHDTYASEIVRYMLARLPNLAPAFTGEGIKAAFSGQNNSVFGGFSGSAEDVHAEQLQDAKRVVAAGMLAALKNYPRGTINWPRPTRATIRDGVELLPNMAKRPRAGRDGNFELFPAFAGAVAIQAARALGPVDGLYGETIPNVRAMSDAIVIGASRLQRKSTGRTGIRWGNSRSSTFFSNWSNRDPSIARLKELYSKNSGVISAAVMAYVLQFDFQYYGVGQHTIDATQPDTILSLHAGSGFVKSVINNANYAAAVYGAAAAYVIMWCEQFQGGDPSVHIQALVNTFGSRTAQEIIYMATYGNIYYQYSLGSLGFAEAFLAQFELLKGSDRVKGNARIQGQSSASSAFDAVWFGLYNGSTQNLWSHAEGYNPQPPPGLEALDGMSLIGGNGVAFDDLQDFFPAAP